MNYLHLNIDDEFLLDENLVNGISINQDFEITIDFISDFKSAKLLRNFVSDLSDKLNIDNIWKSRLILVADELNNNAIEHGSQIGDINNFRLFVTYSDSYINLYIEVTDSGKGNQSKTAKDMILFRNKKKLNGFFKNNGIRGRGLFMIIEKLVDKMYFKDSSSGGLTVGINKKFKKD